MGSRARAVAACAVVVCGLVIVASSCREPTEVTLDVTTKDLCGNITGTAIYVSTDPSAVNTHVQSRSPEALTRTCDGNTIGTLVVTPSSGNGAVVVVAGYGSKQPTDCYEGNYVNCIVARRSFSFVSHTPLHIPIELDLDCLNIPCDEGSTCDHGQCKSAAVDCSSNNTCVTADGSVEVVPGGMLLPDGAPAPIDGGTISDATTADVTNATDGSTTDGATTDGSGSEGGTFACPTTAPCCGPSPKGGPSLVYGCPGSADPHCPAGSCCAGMGGSPMCASALSTALCANGMALCCDISQCSTGQQCCVGDPQSGPCVLPTGTTVGQCYAMSAGSCTGTPCCAPDIAMAATTVRHCGAMLECGSTSCCRYPMAAGSPACVPASVGSCNGGDPMIPSFCCTDQECSGGKCCTQDPGDGGTCTKALGTTPGRCFP